MQPAHDVRNDPKLEEICRDVAHVSCGLGNIVIFYSRAEPSAEFCKLNSKLVVTYGRNYPAGLGMVVLIDADEPPPREAGRKAIRESYLVMGEVIKGGVLIVEGEGFAAAAKRSVITVITTTTNFPFPLRVAGDVQAGAEKMAKMLGKTLDARLTVPLIAAGVNETRARLH